MRVLRVLEPGAEEAQEEDVTAKKGVPFDLAAIRRRAEPRNIPPSMRHFPVYNDVRDLIAEIDRLTAVIESMSRK